MTGDSPMMTTRRGLYTATYFIFALLLVLPSLALGNGGGTLLLNGYPSPTDPNVFIVEYDTLIDVTFDTVLLELDDISAEVTDVVGIEGLNWRHEGANYALADPDTEAIIDGAGELAWITLSGPAEGICLDVDSTFAEWSQDGWEYSLAMGNMEITCSPPAPVLGCTDPDADNYDPSATEDDGSCCSAASTCGGLGTCTEAGACDCTPPNLPSGSSCREPVVLTITDELDLFHNDHEFIPPVPAIALPGFVIDTIDCPTSDVVLDFDAYDTIEFVTTLSETVTVRPGTSVSRNIEYDGGSQDGRVLGEQTHEWLDFTGPAAQLDDLWWIPTAERGLLSWIILPAMETPYTISGVRTDAVVQESWDGVSASRSLCQIVFESTTLSATDPGRNFSVPCEAETTCGGLGTCGDRGECVCTPPNLPNGSGGCRAPGNTLTFDTTSNGETVVVENGHQFTVDPAVAGQLWPVLDYGIPERIGTLTANNDLEFNAIGFDFVANDDDLGTGPFLITIRGMKGTDVLFTQTDSFDSSLDTRYFAFSADSQSKDIDSLVFDLVFQGDTGSELFEVDNVHYAPVIPPCDPDTTCGGLGTCNDEGTCDCTPPNLPDGSGCREPVYQQVNLSMTYDSHAQNTTADPTRWYDRYTCANTPVIDYTTYDGVQFNVDFGDVMTVEGEVYGSLAAGFGTLATETTQVQGWRTFQYLDSFGDPSFTQVVFELDGGSGAFYDVGLLSSSGPHGYSGFTASFLFPEGSSGTTDPLGLCQMDFDRIVTDDPGRLTSFAEPEIDVVWAENDTAIPDGGPAADPEAVDFGVVTELASTLERTYRIENNGAAALDLLGAGTEHVTFTGAEADEFTVQAQPGTPIAADGSRTFTVVWQPVAEGPSAATLSIANSDSDENPYTFELTAEMDPCANSDGTITVHAGDIAQIDDDKFVDGVFTGTPDCNWHVSEGQIETLLGTVEVTLAGPADIVFEVTAIQSGSGNDLFINAGATATLPQIFFTNGASVTVTAGERAQINHEIEAIDGAISVIVNSAGAIEGPAIELLGNITADVVTLEGNTTAGTGVHLTGDVAASESIAINGTGTAGVLIDGSTLFANDGATLTITGSSSEASDAGVEFVSGKVAAGTGLVTITGSSSTTEGIYMDGGSQIVADGDVTLTGTSTVFYDIIIAAGSDQLQVATGTLTLRAAGSGGVLLPGLNINTTSGTVVFDALVSAGSITITHPETSTTGAERVAFLRGGTIGILTIYDATTFQAGNESSDVLTINEELNLNGLTSTETAGTLTISLPDIDIITANIDTIEPAGIDLQNLVLLDDTIITTEQLLTIGTITGSYDLSLTTTNVDVEIEGPVGASEPPVDFTYTGVHNVDELFVNGAFTISGDFTGDGFVSANSDTILSAANFYLNDALNSGGQVPLAEIHLNSPGVTRFTGGVGRLFPPGHVETDALGTTELDGNWMVGAATTDTVIFRDPVLLLDNVSITDQGGGGIDFKSSVDGAFILSCSVTEAAAVRFEGLVGDQTPLASLIVNRGTAELGTVITTTGKQQYDGPVDLFEDTTLNASTISFGDDLIDEDRNLTIGVTSAFVAGAVLDFSDTGSLDVACPSLTMGTETAFSTELGDITIVVDSDTALVDLSQISSIISTGGDISLTVHAASTAEAAMASLGGLLQTAGSGTITINATLDDHTTDISDALEIGGSISAVNGAIDITGIGTTSAETEVRGVHFINSGSVTSTGTGTIDITGEATSAYMALGILFNGDSFVTSNNAAITLEGTAVAEWTGGVQFNVNEGEATVVNSSGGNVSVTGTGSSIGVGSLRGFVNSETGNVLIVGVGGENDIRLTSPLTISKSGGSYAFSGVVVSPAGITASAGSYDVSISDGAEFGQRAEFLNDGQLTLGNDSSSPDFAFDGGLSVTGPSLTKLGGDVTATIVELSLTELTLTELTPAELTLNKPVQLIADSTLTATGDGLVLTLGDTVVGGFSLGLDAPTGHIQGNIGSGDGNALTSLSVDGSTFNLGADITVSDTVTVESGLILTDSSIVTAGSRVDLKGTVDDDAVDSTDSELTINTAGISAFHSTIGGSAAIDRLTTDANENGPTWIGGDITATATGGSLNFGDRVRLLNTVSLTGSSGITFSDTLDSATSGTYGLTLTVSTNTVSFEDDVGEADVLLFLTVNGRNATFRNSPTVLTTGVQTYNAGIAAGTATYTLRAADLEFGGSVSTSNRPTFAPYDSTADVTVSGLEIITSLPNLTLETTPTEFVLDNTDWGHITGSSNRRVYLNTADSTGDVFFYWGSELPAPVVVRGGSTLHMPDIDTTWMMTGQNEGDIAATEFVETFKFESIESGVAGSGDDTLHFGSTGWFDTSFDGGDSGTPGDTLEASSAASYEISGENAGFVAVDEGKDFDFANIYKLVGSDSADTFTYTDWTAGVRYGVFGEGGQDSATWDHSDLSDGVEYWLTDSAVVHTTDETENAVHPTVSIEDVDIDHGAGDDTVTVMVSATTTFTLDGADPEPGDSLTVDGLDNVTTFRDDGTGFDFEGAQSVFHTNFSFANVTNVPVDLSATITDVSVSSIEPGETFTFSTQFKNITPSDIEDVLLSFEVPANTTIDAATGDWTCIPDATAGSACSQARSLDGGDDVTPDIKLTVITPVPAGAEDISLAIAIAHDPEEDPIDDPDVDNNTDTNDETTLIAEPDLVISVEDDPDPVTNNEALTYTIVVTNEGNQGAKGIELTLTAPQHGALNETASPGWSCAADPCTFTYRNDDPEDELPGGDAEFTTAAVFDMPDFFPSGADRITVTASVTDDGLNSTTPNTPTTDSEDKITTIDAEPDLMVTIADSVDSVETDSDITYTVTISNHGNQDATTVELTVTIPTNTSYVPTGSHGDWDCSSGSTCVMEFDEVTVSADPASFDLVFHTNETVPAGVEYLFIDAHIEDDGSDGEDRTLSDNDFNHQTQLDAEPDLDLTKVANLDNAEPGQDIAYTLTMSNIGDQGATGIVLNETVPANTTYNALESTVGWVCDGGAVAAGTECTFELPGMEAEKGRTVIFSVTVDDILPAGETIVHNEALLEDDDANGDDPNADNDSAFDDVELNHEPGLLVGLTHTGEDLPMPEDLIPFDVEWANTGAQGVSGVVMTMSVPTGTTFSTVHSDSWDCGGLSVAGTACTFDIDSVPSGDGGVVVFAVIADDDLEPGATISFHADITDDGESASRKFETDDADEDVLLNREPEVDNAPGNQNATEEDSFSWTLPEDVFSDPDTVRGDTLTVTASSDEPGWVNLDGDDLTFWGTPTPSDVGTTVTFEVTATDERGLTESLDIHFTVNNINNAPVIDDDAAIVATEIWEDAFVNDGDLVSDLIEDLITDADGGANTGIALVYADDTNGIWEFRLADDGEWTALGTLSESDALVLDAGDEERIRFVPNADYFGAVEARLVAWDGTDGSSSGDVEVVIGTPGGDSAFSAESALLTIDVLSVNDAPSFAAGDDVSISEDTGVVNVPEWAIDMSTGPENESEQSFAFELTTDDDDVFDVVPTVDGDGTLSFRTARNAVGTVTVTVVAADDGGTEREGVDRSEAVEFTISVGAVNDGPLFVDPTPSGTLEVNEDEELAFEIVAEDPDGPELILTVSGAPSTAEVDLENGTFRWTPTYLDWGVWEIVLNAHDGTLFDERVLEIVVIVADTNDNGIPDTFETDNGLDLDGDDADGDGIPNLVEIGDYRFPADSDDDGNIDAVETDSDDDGVDDEVEAGDDPENPVDSDDDGTPDYQDEDSDDDDLDDDVDNCRTVVNVDQADRDGDGEGDLCDDDIDGDGLDNDDELDLDLDPEDEDTDGDTISDGDEVSDASDPEDTDEDDIIDALDPDSDDDGITDAEEAGDDLVDTEPLDTDDDGTPNFRDTDSDDDDVDDLDDNCPIVANTEQTDTDGDGAGNECDGDQDGDGLVDEEDNCTWVVNPGQNDLDEDGEGDDCDDDIDGDGVVNVDDNCPLTDNPDQGDDDLDTMGNACDPLTTNIDPPGSCNCSVAVSQSRADWAWLLVAVIGLVAVRRRHGRL